MQRYLSFIIHIHFNVVLVGFQCRKMPDLQILMKLTIKSPEICEVKSGSFIMDSDIGPTSHNVYIQIYRHIGVRSVGYKNQNVPKYLLSYPG